MTPEQVQAEAADIVRFALAAIAGNRAGLAARIADIEAHPPASDGYDGRPIVDPNKATAQRSSALIACTNNIAATAQSAAERIRQLLVEAEA